MSKGNTQLRNACEADTVLPLNMTFWDGTGTPVASVSASHKSFNSGSCPSCAVKVMLCLFVPETKTVIIINRERRQV